MCHLHMSSEWSYASLLVSLVVDTLATVGGWRECRDPGAAYRSPGESVSSHRVSASHVRDRSRLLLHNKVSPTYDKCILHPAFFLSSG